MPTFQVTLPDGRKFRVNAPAGSTPEQVYRWATMGDAGSADRKQVDARSQLYYQAHAAGNAVVVKNMLDWLQRHHATLAPANADTQAKVAKIAQETAEAHAGGPIPNTPVGFAAGEALGALHHFNNPTFGAAQDVLQGTSGLFHLMGSHLLDAAVHDYKAWLGTREANYQAVTQGNVGSDVGAVVGSVAPWLAGVGELRALGMLPKVPEAVAGAGALAKAGSLALRGGALAAGGAAMGAVNPETGPEPFGRQKLHDIEVNAALAPVLGALGEGAVKALGGVRHLASLLTPAGRRSYAGRWLVNELRRRNLDPDAIATKLEAAHADIPGETVSMRSGAPSVETSQIDRALLNKPASQIPMRTALNATDKARMDVVRAMADVNEAGVEGTRLADARKVRADHYAAFQARFMDQASPDAWSSPKPVIDAIVRLSRQFTGNKAVMAVLADARRDIQNNLSPTGRVPNQVLQGIRMNARDNLVREMNGADPSDAAMKGIDDLTKAVRDHLNAAVPGYKEAMAQYAKDSEPINAIKVGRRLLARAHRLNADELPFVNETDVRSVLKADDRAQFKLPKAERAKLEALQRSLQRSAVSNAKLGTQGSDTSQLEQLGKVFHNPWAMRLAGGLTLGALGATVGAGAGAASGNDASRWGEIGGMMGAVALTPSADRLTWDLLTQKGELAASAPKAAAAIRAARSEEAHNALRDIAAKGLPFDIKRERPPELPPGGGPPPTPPAPPSAPRAPEPAPFVPGTSRGVNNASGESSASMEAQGRVRDEKAMGRTRAIIRRNGTVEPLYGVDAVDHVAQPGEVVVQRGIGADPNAWVPLNSGPGVSSGMAAARVQQALPRLDELEP